MWFTIFLSIGIFGYLLPTTDYLNVIPGGLGDARFNSVVLEHLYLWISGREEQLWSPRFFYPFEGMLAFSDNHFVSGLPYVILRTFNIGREHAFLGWFMVGNLLNFVSAYIVLRRFGLSAFGAAVGAFVYSFAIPVLPKEGHAQLVYRFASPFALLALIDTLKMRRLVPHWRIVFWVTIQFFCSIYLGVFICLLLFLVFVVSALLGDCKGLIKSIYASAFNEPVAAIALSLVSTLLCMSALAWLLYNYHVVSADYGLLGGGLNEQLRSMLPRVSSYFLADYMALSSWVGAWVHDIPLRWEHQMFFGIGVWVLMVFGVVKSVKEKALDGLGNVVGLSLLLLILLTLNVGGHSLYILLEDLPGLSAVRAFSRIVLVMLLPVAVLAGLGADSLYLRPRSTPKAFGLAGFLVVVVCLESLFYQSYYSNTVDEWRERQETMRRLLPRNVPADAILNFTDFVTDPYYLVELDAMILAQDLGLATLNGYSGHAPPGYLNISPCHPNNRLEGYAAFRDIADPELRALQKRVRHVSVGGAKCINVSRDQAKKIEVSLADLQIVKGNLNVIVTVKNESRLDLDSRSSPGAPLRLSWRLVPISGSGQVLEAPGWDARQDIGKKILAGRSIETVVTLPFPEDGRIYRLEITIVIEHVAWLHDLGMDVASQVVP